MNQNVSPEVALQAIKLAVEQVLEDRGDHLPTDFGVQTFLYAQDELEGTALDLDSLDALDLVTALEESLGIQLPDEVDYGSLLTIGDVVNAVVEVS